MKINFSILLRNTTQKKQKCCNRQDPELEPDPVPIKIQINTPQPVNKSLSPYSYHQELSSLQKQNIISKSTLNFIKRQVQNTKTHPSNTSSQPTLQPNKYKSSNLNTNKDTVHNKMATNKQKKIKNQKQKQIKKQQLTSWEVKEMQQLKQTTFRPILTHTKNSHPSKKADQKRNIQHNTNFEALHQDSVKYKYHKMVRQQQIQQQQIQQQQMQSQKYGHKKSQNLDKYISIYDRLDKLMEKYSQNRKYNPINPNQFQPDLSISKRTYQKLFSPTKANSIKPIQIINETVMTIKSKQQQHSLKHLQNTLPTTKSILNRSLELVSSRDDAIANRIVNLLYKDSQNSQIQSFQRSRYNCLSRKEKTVLKGFLTEIQQLQNNQNVDKYMFCALFLKHYKKMNFYDKQLLRESMLRHNRLLKHDNGMKCSVNKQYPSINIKSKSLQSLSSHYQQMLNYI